METLQANIDGTLRTNSENFHGWQTYAGGRLTSEPGKTRDPGAPLARNIPGGKAIENITLTRDYDESRDGPALERLEALCGTDEAFYIGKVIRDGKGNVLRVKSRVGILIEVMGPEGNTNGGADKGTLEVVLAVNA